MDLQVGIPDIDAARIQANKIEDKETRETMLLLCAVTDALIRNMEAMVDTENQVLNQRVFSIQDLLDRSVLKTYELRDQRSQVVGPFRRRN